MLTPRKEWTDSEVLQVVDLYVRTPFGRIHNRNPEVIALANSQGRSPNSIALKMANLASLDETLDRKGMSNSTKMDRRIWTTFFEALKQQVGLIGDIGVAQNSFADHDQVPLSGSFVGATIPRIVNARQGQHFFRQMIMGSYEEKCAITGISQKEFLVAGHIRSWSLDPENRLNPRNGICLNRLHDKAFEEGLITISVENDIIYSRKMEGETREKMQRLNDTGHFAPPARFKPDPVFLEYHRDVVFQS